MYICVCVDIYVSMYRSNAQGLLKRAFLCLRGCTRAVDSASSFSMNRSSASARHRAWAPSRLHRPRRHRESATAAALFPTRSPSRPPTHFTFCSRRSQADWLKALTKKNRRFSVWFSLCLVSSFAFLAKSRSQFFPLRLHVASLCHPPTHLLICITTVVACNPEGSASPAPFFSKVIIQHGCVKKKKERKKKEKIAPLM